MLQQEELINLYKSGRSMMEISKILGCSNSEVRYWMKKFQIKRRGHSEASYFKQNPQGDPFNIKSDLIPNEKMLYGLGIGIYWGEGTKVGGSLKVTNTDPGILKIFIKFLTQICNANKNKISYSIISFNDIDPEIARLYWSSQLKISPEKFGKITQIPKQGKGTYKRKSKFGVCNVHFSNIKLKKWIMEQIELAKNFDFA